MIFYGRTIWDESKFCLMKSLGIFLFKTNRKSTISNNQVRNTEFEVLERQVETRNIVWLESTLNWRVVGPLAVSGGEASSRQQAAGGRWRVADGGCCLPHIVMQRLWLTVSFIFHRRGEYAATPASLLMSRSSVILARYRSPDVPVCGPSYPTWCTEYADFTWYVYCD